MLIHNTVVSTVNGPGKRFVVWVAGCTLSCPSCWNPETHLHGQGTSITGEDLVTQIAATPDIEGITLSGGEPMQQAPSLARMLRTLKSRRPDLSVGMYSGYTERELDNGAFHWHHSGLMLQGSTHLWNLIKADLDFAILGRYNQDQATTKHALRGSKNQVVRFFSPRYTEKDLEQQMVEITIAPGGLTQVTGFPVGIYKQVTAGLMGQTVAPESD